VVRKGHPAYYCDLKDSNCTQSSMKKVKKKLYLYTISMNMPAISMNFSFQVHSENMKSHA